MKNCKFHHLKPTIHCKLNSQNKSKTPAKRKSGCMLVPYKNPSLLTFAKRNLRDVHKDNSMVTYWPLK